MAMSAWQLARQRDFSGGESLALLPEKVGRNQLICAVNTILSPEGELTECWQMDKALFVNVSGGIVVTPVPGSTLYKVYASSDTAVVSFIFDPASPVAYDLADPSGYPGYESHDHANPVTIAGISHGTPFLGKNYCCAATSLYTVGELTASPESVDFGTVQTLTANKETLVITNTTEEVITLTGVTLSGDGSPMFGHTGAFPQTLDPDDSYSFDVAYQPSVPGNSVATLNLSNNLGVTQIQLAGTAESMLSEAPDSYNFGLVNQGSSAQHTFQVTNAGDRAATITQIGITGDDYSRFNTGLVLPAEIAAGATLDIVVTFIPGPALHACAAEVSVVTDVGTIDGISLTGTGILWTVTPPSASLLGIGIGKPVFANFVVSNKTEDSPLTITAVYISGPALSVTAAPVVPFVINPGGTAGVTVAFSYPFSGFPPQVGSLIVESNWGTITIPINYAGHT